MYIRIMMHEHNSFRKYFIVSLKTFNFAANKTEKCVQMQAKDNLSNSMFLNIFYLVGPNKRVTHIYSNCLSPHTKAIAMCLAYNGLSDA